MPDSEQRPGDVLRKMAAGGAAAVCVRTMEAPLERVKLLLQNQNMIKRQSQYAGIIDALRRVNNEQGFLSFWRGNPTNCLRILPTYALRFTLMD